MRVFRTKQAWRVCFYLFVGLTCLISLVVQGWFAGAGVSSERVWGVLFFNGLTVVVSLFLGVVGFMKLRVGRDRLLLYMPFFSRTILEKDLIGWGRRSGSSRFFVLFWGKRRKLAIDVSVFEDRAELTSTLEEFLKGTPQGVKGIERALSPAWEALFVVVLTYLAVTGGLALGWTYAFAFGLPVAVWFFVASYLYQFEAYIQGGKLWIGSASYELSKLRGVHMTVSGSYVNGTIAVFGYDDVILSSNLTNYEELRDELFQILSANRMVEGFKPLPSYYWDSFYSNVQ